MTAFENVPMSQKVRAAIHRDVRAISSETCHFLGLEITKSAMEVIAELVFKKVSLYGSDLEAFAKHAKRSTVNSEDVKLLVRRNQSLKTHLNKISPATPTAPKEKRRKTIPKTTETPGKSNDNENINKDISTNENVNKDIITDEDLMKRDTNITSKVIDDDGLDDFVENMILDNTIDLTFD